VCPFSNGTALLRCSVCAAHSRRQLETIVETLTGIGYRCGLLGVPAEAAVA